MWKQRTSIAETHLFTALFSLHRAKKRQQIQYMPYLLSVKIILLSIPAAVSAYPSYKYQEACSPCVKSKRAFS